MGKIYEWTIQVTEKRVHRVTVTAVDELQIAIENAYDMFGDDTVIYQDFDDYEVIDKEYYGRY